MVHAFGIFSGGLDSLLSARLLMEQGLKPTLVSFTSPFFPEADRFKEGAQALGLNLIIQDLYDEMLPLIKNPPHGRGRNLNPCIDCHALMFRRAGELLKETHGDGFIFSGEVLGQRPMSQNSGALKTVAQSSGVGEQILRPLSALIMAPTLAEINGWVDRQRLLGLSGRKRSAQISLATKWGLPIPTPAGGCLLTDANYCARFKWLLDQPQKSDPSWPPRHLAEIFKRGRIFSSEPGLWVAVGRNQGDNEALAALAQADDRLFHLEGAPGPTVLLPQTGAVISDLTIKTAAGLAASYGDHGGKTETLVCMDYLGQKTYLPTSVYPPSHWAELMIPPQTAKGQTITEILP
ncbi:MAG: tRNA 4-thiouridine(8) synthase ThiI [Candidatus Adiutrix sp.]